MLPSELIAKLGECAITNFSAARDGWFDKQTVFSGIVIAGLVFEGPELIHELLAIAQKNFPSFRYVFPDALVEYAKIGAFVGWILIIAGLLGEMKASSRIVDLSAHIQECSDAKVTKATLEAGDAATSASLARREAARAKDNADVAAKLAADERSKRIKLANLLNPRSLNEQERKEIADELRPVANPDVKVEIFTTSGNGLRLGILIWNALKDAGYNPILQNPSTEVWYETNVGGPIESRATVEAISKALNKKLPLFGLTPTLPRGSPVRVTVGEKMIGAIPAELLSGTPKRTKEHRIADRK